MAASEFMTSRSCCALPAAGSAFALLFRLAAVFMPALAAPALAATPPTLTNYYNLFALAPPYEATLNSYVDCGASRCDIAYSIVVSPIDRYVTVVWNDKHGARLISGVNSYLSNFYDPKDFGGKINAVEWREGKEGSAVLVSTPLSEVGTADFTGTGSGSAPCGINYVCNDAEYYYWAPSIFKPATGGVAPLAAGAARQAANGTPVPLGAIIGSLSNVGVDFGQPEIVGDLRVEFIEFRSAIEFDADHYLYRYSVTNFTDLSIPFNWAAAGLSGELGPFAAVQRELASSAEPNVLSSLPTWTLQTGDQFPLSEHFANRLDVLVPVPEPGTWLLFAAGLALLGCASHQRSKR